MENTVAIPFTDPEITAISTALAFCIPDMKDFKDKTRVNDYKSALVKIVRFVPPIGGAECIKSALI